MDTIRGTPRGTTLIHGAYRRLFHAVVLYQEIRRGIWLSISLSFIIYVLYGHFIAPQYNFTNDADQEYVTVFDLHSVSDYKSMEMKPTACFSRLAGAVPLWYGDVCYAPFFRQSSISV